MIQVSEPMTVLTDYVMAALAFYWFWELGQGAKSQARVWWKRTFLSLALSSFLGGSDHGFADRLRPWAASCLWQSTLLVALLASFCLLRAASAHFQPRRGSGLLERFAGLKLLLAISISLFQPVFLVVLLDSLATLILGSVLASARRPRAWNPPAYFLTAVLLFLVGGTIQALKLAPHPLFNHNDLFHVIQIVANGMFFLCAKSKSQLH